MKELWEQCIESTKQEISGDPWRDLGVASRLLDKNNANARDLWKKLSKQPVIRDTMEGSARYSGALLYVFFCTRVLEDWDRIAKQSPKEYKSGLLKVAQKARELKLLLVKETPPAPSLKSILETWRSSETLPEVSIDKDFFWCEPGATPEYKTLGGDSLLLRGIIEEHEDDYLFLDENTSHLESDDNDPSVSSNLIDAQMALHDASSRSQFAYREHIRQESAAIEAWAAAYKGPRDEDGNPIDEKDRPEEKLFRKSDADWILNCLHEYTFTRLLDFVAKRAEKLSESELIVKKPGANNARVIYFARRLYMHHREIFGQPFWDTIALAVNICFDPIDPYDKSSIRDLFRGGQPGKSRGV